jgi:DNA-binding transcriptional MerR regulator
MIPQKSPEAFRTISEVADTLDVPAHVLRFWESKFPQIKPIKRGGGRRYYRPDDVNLLKGIRHLLYTEGLTIKGVQKVLKDQGARSVAQSMVDPVPDAEAMAEIESSIAAIELPPSAAPGAALQLETPIAVAAHTRAPLSDAARTELESIIAGLESLRDRMR